MKLKFEFLLAQNSRPPVGSNILVVYKKEFGFKGEPGVWGWNMTTLEVTPDTDITTFGDIVYYATLPVDQILADNWPCDGCHLSTCRKSKLGYLSTCN